MSNLIRRMQRMSSRGEHAKKAAIDRKFATQLGVHNPKAKDAVARANRRTAKAGPPRALRRCKPNKAQLARRARKAVA